MRKLIILMLLLVSLAGCESHSVICGSDGSVYEQSTYTLSQDTDTEMDGQSCKVNKDGSFTVYTGTAQVEDDSN